MLSTVLAEGERWDNMLASMKAAGHDVGDVRYEDMRRFVEDDAYNVKMSQNWRLYFLLQSAATLLDLLPARQWSLFHSTDEIGHFATSDNPAILTWTELMPAAFPPGFGASSTEVKLPLTSHTSVAGRFEGPSGAGEANAKYVAAVNTQTVLHADRFVYAPTLEFPCVTPDGKIVTGREFFQ